MTIILLIIIFFLYTLAALLTASGLLAMSNLAGQKQDKRVYLIALMTGIAWPIAAVDLTIKSLRNKPTEYEKKNLENKRAGYEKRLNEIMNMPK